MIWNKLIKNIFIILNFCLSIVLLFLILKTKRDKQPEVNINKIDAYYREFLSKQDSIQNKIDSLKILNNSLEEKIVNYESEKVIIKNIYHEKISSIDTISSGELKNFFSERYGIE